MERTNVDLNESIARLSPWWRNTAILVLVLGFTVLIWIAVRSYQDAPPIPAKVVGPAGETLFSRERFNKASGNLSEAESDAADAETGQLLKQNRYDPQSETLTFTPSEAASYRKQIATWADYFSRPAGNGGLPAKYITNPEDLRLLSSFFAWTAWASVANRPDKPYSYTNNFPYDRVAGNTPTSDAVLWSALSLITLLAGTAGVLFAFGKFDFLGWQGKGEHVHPQLLPGVTTASQRATIKYFVIVALLFLGQALVGGATVHYRVDPASFYGIDISGLLPSHILRTWHLQLAIFWIATAYVAGGLLLAPSVGAKEPAGQARGVNLLFGALLIVVVGSLCGEILGINQLLGRFWFWFGHQGWEYLDLGRAWQILLAIGLVFWVVLLFRGIAPARNDPERQEISSLFLYAAIAIPLFYLPAMFFDSTSHFSVVDTWRFWIIHLWVEGFFEVFVTVMVALIFYQLGIVSHQTAARVVYLDAILYLGSGIIGTGHHWYWTGQSNVTMALAAVFSAMEVVPLTLLTLDAWDFVKLTKGTCDVCGKAIAVPHRWTFYFLIAVGCWNFVGAGVFGFLINLPIVSYFEVGTMLTPNHGHAAMMGVFGMLAVALTVFALRQVSTDEQWERPERFIRVSFWGLNIGLALMVVTNLFPGGVLQLFDVLNNGYWHARGPEFLQGKIPRLIEWLRMPGDLVFIFLGAFPLLVAALLTWRAVRVKSPA